MLRFAALAALTLLTGCLLTGCASTGAAMKVGQDFMMAPGEQVTLPDASTLHYTGIANDSRCPPDVQCIRAGDADVLIDYVAATGAAAKLTLNTERTRSTSLGPWRLRLVDLARGDAPVTTLRLEPNNGTAAP